MIAYRQGIGMANLFGMEVHFLGWQPPFPANHKEVLQKKIVFFHRIRSTTYPSLSTDIADLFLISQVVALLEMYQIDLIHCHYAIPFALCAEIAKIISKKSVKTICTLHGTDVIGIGKSPMLIHTTQYSLSTCDAITCVSQNLRKNALRFFSLPPQKIQVIPNFIHQEILPRPLVTKSSKKKFITIHISNLRNIKNPIAALTIFQKFQKNKENCFFWIVGDGPLAPHLREKIILWNLQDKVKFWGVHKNVFSLLQKADVCLVSSVYESFCLVALEAISCGIPVVAPRVGGIPELAKHAPKSIHLYNIKNLQQPVTLLQTIYENKILYKETVLKDQSSIKNVFSKEKILQQYFLLYKSLLSAEDS